MAALTPESRLTVLTAVALVLSMAVQWDRHNLYVFLVPNIVTFVVLIASQVRCPSSLVTMRVVFRSFVVSDIHYANAEPQ